MALTKEEEAALSALESKYAGQSDEPGLTAEQAAHLAALEQKYPPPPPGAMDYALGGMGAIGKLYDVVRAGTGGPIMGEAIEAAVAPPGKQVYSKEEILDAINPTNLKGFPTTSEMLARAGVKEKGALSDIFPGVYATPGGDQEIPWYQPEKGGLLDVTGRGTIGLAGDIASDPLTYLTGGLAAVPRVGSKALRRSAMPITSTLSRAGKSIYESGIRPLIQAGEDFGKDVGKSFYEMGIRGSPKKMQEQAERIALQMKNEADTLARAAAEKGAAIPAKDMLQEQFSRIDAEVGKVGGLTEKEGQAIKKDLFERFAKTHDLSPEQVIQGKENIYTGMPSSAYREGARTGVERKLDKAFANQLKTTAEKLVEEATPGAGKKLAEANVKRGDILTTRKALDRMVKRAENVPSALTPWPTSPTEWMLALGGSGLGVLGDTAHGIGLGPAAVAGKRMADLTRAPGFRTSLGYGLRKGAESPLLAPIVEGGARRLLTNPTGYYGRLLKDEEQQ